MCLLAMLASGLPTAVAQDEDEPEIREAVDDPVPSILKEGLLQTNFRLELRGPDGGHVLTNMTLEELRRLERQSKAAAQLPAATFIQSQVTAVVRDSVAEVVGTFEVQLGTSQTPASIDLRFGTCRLSEPPEQPTGEVRSLFQVDRDTGGYQWLLLGKENSQHKIVLKGKSPVRQKSDRHTLAIDLPSALTTIEVLLPANAVEERVRSEDVLERAVSEEGVRLKINSRGGDFTLTWREQGALQRVAAIEAESRTTFEIIDPQQPWVCSTTLLVRSYGSDTNHSFRISLPQGAQWRMYPSPEFDRFRITTLDPAETENREEVSEVVPPAARVASAQQLLVETIDPSTTESIELLLEWEWMPETEESDGSTTQVAIPVPSISGVDVHEGTIDCIFPASYAAVFKEGPGARLVQQGRLPLVFGRQQMQFQFDRQDFELEIGLRRELSLPTIRPTYKVDVDQHKLVLTAWFDCSFDTNSQQMEIGLIAGDWIVEENTARVLRAPNDPFSTESEVLNVRRQDDGSYILSGREPDAGFGNSRRIEQVWRIVAERSWSPDDNHALEFQIPEIIRGRTNGSAETDHGSGVLLVTSANSVVTRWKATASTGLLPDSFSTDYQKFVAEARVREPLAYRFQSRGTTPNWAGWAEFLPQQISGEQHSILEVLASEILVRQDFELRIANEPLSNLRIALREDVSPAPQVFVNGALTSIQPVGTTTSSVLRGAESAQTDANEAGYSSDQVTWKQYQLVGAPLLSGAAQLSILSSVPWSMPLRSNDAAPLAAAEVDVPLAQILFPSSARMVRQDWTLINDVKFDVNSPDASSSLSEVQLSGSKRRPLRDKQLTVPLKLRQRETAAEAPVLVDGSWLQTVITGSERRDRFVARVRSESGKLNIKLPSAAQIEKVAVDGVPVEQPAAPYDYNTKSVSIALPPTSDDRTHVVELFYFMDETLNWITPLRIEPPVIEGAENLDRFYWQLVVPAMQHLGWSPTGLTADWTWNWSGLWWYRQSGEDQASLERWLGSSIQTRQSLSSNSYVMSGQGDFKPQNIHVLSRFALWFPIGSVAILLSVLALNFSVLRSPVTGILLAGGIASLAMFWPDLAVLLGQTALLSLSLVALILATQAAIEARVRRRSVFTTRPSTYMDGSDHFSVGRGLRGPQSTAVRTGSSVVAVEEK